jgi:diguanylate cyclase (GGDEF)-like protein/PAS domain S-box-containing protein
MDELSYEKLLDSLFDGVYYVEMNKNITFWNKGAERITGYTKSEVMDSCCANNILRHIDNDGRDLCIDGCPVSATLNDGKPRQADVWLHHKFGHRVPISVRISPVRDENGIIIGATEVFTDNSNANQIIHELGSLNNDIYSDTLTGVGNRKYGVLSLETLINKWNTYGIPFGILFLDIDHFTLFNDNYGHDIGDRVLESVAMSISNATRRNDITTRWGGEEFIILLPGINKEILRVVAERIRMVIEHSFIMLGNEKLKVTASLGGTFSHLNDTAETILKRADALMYKCKASGRNQVTLDI